MKLICLYPDLLNLYGEHANLLVLQRALAQTGHPAEIVSFAPDEQIRLSDADFIYAGAGTESHVEAARRALAAQTAEFRAAAEAGIPMLFTGSAAELTARAICMPDGEAYPCLGLTDCVAVRTAERQLGDILYESALSDQLLAGFINKSGYLKGVAEPRFRAKFGPGGILNDDGTECPAEGIRTGSVMATYAIGPILARNPWLKRWTAAEILRRKFGTADLSGIEPDYADKGYDVTVAELLKRAQNA